MKRWNESARGYTATLNSKRATVFYRDGAWHWVIDGRFSAGRGFKSPFHAIADVEEVADDHADPVLVMDVLPESREAVKRRKARNTYEGQPTAREQAAFEEAVRRDRDPPPRPAPPPRQAPPLFTRIALRPAKLPEWARVLGVSHPLSLARAREAWKKLALIHHPDRGGAHDRMVMINVAWNQAQKELQ
jgi:hypothetical protein